MTSETEGEPRYEGRTVREWIAALGERSLLSKESAMYALENGDTTVNLKPIGRVESSIKDLDDAPRQADEGAPEATVVFDPAVHAAMRGLSVGDDIILLTWLDRADRDVLSVHPRGDTSRPETGVFCTRSPDRPNPVGLHQVKVTAIDGLRVWVNHLEVIDGTPIIDVKPVLSTAISTR
jgi:tRNA-Thr(GGU) m(6)t(6)A37 methyltransferase TsaA